MEGNTGNVHRQVEIELSRSRASAELKSHMHREVNAEIL